MATCPQCHCEYKPKRQGKRPQLFCSRSCAAKSRPGPGTYRKGKHYGRMSDEHRLKIGLSKLGKKRKPFSDEWKRKLAVSRYKERNGNWRGGITKQHLVIRTSRPYRLWKLAVFERDLYTCQECGITGVILEAHHIKSFSQYPELRFDVNNGLTLCKLCHLKTDNYGRKSNQ